MTTIVYRDGVMAADSLTTRGNMKDPSSLPKLFRLGDGSIVGTSGVIVESAALLKWLADGAHGPAPSHDDCTLLHLRTDGTRWIYWGGCDVPLESTSEFDVLGSGDCYAIGALHHGASAEEAVAVACRCDVNSGLPVQVMTLHEDSK